MSEKIHTCIFLFSNSFFPLLIDDLHYYLLESKEGRLNRAT